MSSSFVPPTEARVPAHVPKSWNDRIRDASIDRVEKAKDAPRNELTSRLNDLACEWDMERTLMFNASIAASTGLILSYTVSERWLWFTVAVLAFLLQHAVQGWCPPMPVFRYFGFRTAEEIQDEATALKVLRGDFNSAFEGGALRNKEYIVRNMAKLKRSCGTFFGEGASKVAAE